MQRSLRVLAASLNQESLRIYLLAAFCLVGLHYFASTGTALRTLTELGLDGWSQSFRAWIFSGTDAALNQRLFWALASDVLYLLIPLLCLRYWSYRPLKAYGLNISREPGFWKLYGYALLVMLPLVTWMASTSAFQHLYPFYKPVLKEGWLLRWTVYELAYLSQFFALEFFFRGMLVHGLRPVLGIQAIPAMMLPYCMLHFGKPLPETIASIAAGLVLGLVSYRSRSIALGFLLHGSVALSMDTLVLWHKGYFTAGLF